MEKWNTLDNCVNKTGDKIVLMSDNGVVTFTREELLQLRKENERLREAMLETIKMASDAEEWWVEKYTEPLEKALEGK